MKLYLVEYYDKDKEWFDDSVLAGIFSDKKKAEEIVNKIESLYDEVGEYCYSSYIVEIESDTVSDYHIKEKLKEQINK